MLYMNHTAIYFGNMFTDRILNRDERKQRQICLRYVICSSPMNSVLKKFFTSMARRYTAMPLNIFDKEQN